MCVYLFVSVIIYLLFDLVRSHVYKFVPLLISAKILLDIRIGKSTDLNFFMCFYTELDFMLRNCGEMQHYPLHKIPICSINLLHDPEEYHNVFFNKIDYVN